WNPVTEALLPGPGAFNPPLLDEDTDPNYEVNGKGPATTGDLEGDFIAVVNAKSADIFEYGAVVNTAQLAPVLNGHILAEVEFGLEPGALGDVGLTPRPTQGTGGLFEDAIAAPFANEAHHTSAFLIETNDGRRLMYAGGLISANVFGCDVTDPMNIRPIDGTMVGGDIKDIVYHYDAYGDGDDPDSHPDYTQDKYNNLCGLAISGGFGATNHLSLTDDIIEIGDGLQAISYLGFKGNWGLAGGVGSAPQLPPTLTTPGGVVVFNESGSMVKEFSAVLNKAGPLRHKPRWQCIPCAVFGEDITTPQDTNAMANPHGIFVREDLGTLVTSDYGDGTTIALSGHTPLGLFDETAADTQAQGLDSTVRFWDLYKLKTMSGIGGDDVRPVDIAQAPDGPRNEGRTGDGEAHMGSSSVTMDEFIGLMAAWTTNCTGGPSDDPGCSGQHKGGWVASMCGGTLFYIEDMTTWQYGETPTLHAVYDSGPCTGMSVFFTTQDDTYIVMPISGIITPGQPLYNRDYPFQHSRRVVLFDIRPTVDNLDDIPGIQCDYADASTYVQSDEYGYEHRFDGSPTTVFAPYRNNGAGDCPVLADQDLLDNLDTLLGSGGPHFTLPDPAERRVVSSLYFLDLREFAAPAPVGQFPGSASIGDDRVCMFKMDKHLDQGIGQGRITRDTAFGLYTDVPSYGDEGQRYGPHAYFTYFDGCVDFDRKSWPHGDSGHGTPHGMTWWTS
ncbi:hypothetical protein MNBD_GAMMA13-1496, partial [hydrothermal vent metagenome]